MTTPRDRFSGLSASMRTVLMIGKEPYLASEGAKRLARLLREEFGDVDRLSYGGETAELSDVLDELRSFALIRHHKLVTLDNAERFLAGDPRRRRAVEAYVAAPTPDATLLMRAETWRPGKLDALVAKHGAIIKCDPLGDREAVAWCVARCGREYGCEIDRAVAALLVERVGTGLGRLDSELAKLAAFVGDRTKFGRADVEDLVGQGRQEQAWALQSALLSGRPAEACLKTRRLMEVSRLDATLVMWAISDLLRRLHTTSQLLRRGERMGPHYQRLRLSDGLIDAARRGEPALFAQLLQRAVSTDLRTKSGLGDPQRNLEALTLQVTDTIGCL